MQAQNTRYMLFGGADHDAIGGMHDLVATFYADDDAEAQALAKTLLDRPMHGYVPGVVRAYQWGELSAMDDGSTEVRWVMGGP